MIRGNHTTPELRSIINIALLTGMRLSEILRIDPEHAVTEEELDKQTHEKEN